MAMRCWVEKQHLSRPTINLLWDLTWKSGVRMSRFPFGGGMLGQVHCCGYRLTPLVG